MNRVNKIKNGIDENIFETIVTAIIAIAVILSVLPLINIVAVSLSSNYAIVSGKVAFLPIGINLEAYKAVFFNAPIMKSLGFTIVLTLVNTALCMFMTICAAYPLTKKRLKGRSFFTILMLFTMYFGGGMIPDYLLTKSLGLLNTIWALVLPGLVGTYNMIILKSFFQSLPPDLEEAANVDGCSDIGILVKIVLPLSTPVLATLSLFYAVSRWNGFQDALIYITNPNVYPIQLKLYNLVMNSMVNDLTSAEGSSASQVVPESLKAASIMVATLPILCAYPWLQKYFVSGVMLGAVKA